MVIKGAFLFVPFYVSFFRRERTRHEIVTYYFNVIYYTPRQSKNIHIRFHADILVIALGFHMCMQMSQLKFLMSYSAEH